jgi:predicted lipoprotein with Yx(FWY)xxD motif
MRRVLVVALLAGGLVAAATAAATSSSSAVVRTAFNKTLKKTILVDASGRTLYMYTAETNGAPACFNDSTYHCSKAWPPLLTTGAPHAGQGAKASLLGTVKRIDGGVQVTYHRHPLYYFHGGSGLGKGDTKPGDVAGQGVLTIWYVLSPAGNPIK